MTVVIAALVAICMMTLAMFWLAAHLRSLATAPWKIGAALLALGVAAALIILG